jgi:hypothetical protein
VPAVPGSAAREQRRNVSHPGCLQAHDRLEVRAQRPVGEVLQQPGGRGRVHAGSGQHAAQVLDHIRAGPGALSLLSQRQVTASDFAHTPADRTPLALVMVSMT